MGDNFDLSGDFRNSVINIKSWDKRGAVKAEVMDLTAVCQTFPEAPSLDEPYIQRDNILDTLEKMLRGNNPIVIVEGEEGIGKTTLLAQFAKRHPDHAISLFITTENRWAYNPDFLLLEYGNQLQWILHKEEFVTLEDIDKSFLTGLFYALQRRARRRGETYYFIIDGLLHIPEEDAHIQKIILEMLPLGTPNFRFIFSGDSERLDSKFTPKRRFKSLFLPTFTPDETSLYLRDLVLDRDVFEEVRKISNGSPGFLAGVRRILRSGTDAKSLLDSMPTELSHLFEIEWRKVQLGNEAQLLSLAVMAHDRRGHSLDHLAKIIDQDVDALSILLADLTFVQVDPHTSEVNFVSEAFRKYAAHQLRSLKDRVTSLVIQELLNNPNSDAALTYLPDYLEQARRYEDLVDYLSSDNFVKMLSQSQSLGIVAQKANLGLKAAREVRRDGDLLRFSVQRSAITELDGADIWRSEVEARLALGDYNSALALAQSTILKEDRLHLLSIIAKDKLKQGSQPELELVDQIRQLYQEIDPSTLGDRAVEIARDLIYVDDNLAIELVEKAKSADTGEHDLDWAYINLSIAAISASKRNPSSQGMVESIRSRITDPKVRLFSEEIPLLFEETSAASIIAEVNKLENVERRLFLLRHWCVNNRERPDASLVVNFALSLAISSTAYTLNAKVLRELAVPLPFIEDETTTRELVGRFDSQKGTAEHYGPTEEFVRLQLLLAQTEGKFDLENAVSRLDDIYLRIAYVGDLVTRTACYARLVSTLARIQVDNQSTVIASIESLALNELDISVQQVLNASADQLVAVEGVIRALTESSPDMAIRIGLMLNTEYRRDEALQEFIETSLKVQQSHINLLPIYLALNNIVDLEVRDEAIVSIVKRLSQIQEVNNNLFQDALPILEMIESLQDATMRCNACFYAINFCKNRIEAQHVPLIDNLFTLLRQSWDSIDIGWNKVNTGFKVTKAFAKFYPDVSKNYLGLTEQFRENTLLDTDATATAYVACVRLSLRAYLGLLPKNIDTEEDLRKLAKLLDRIPSNGERARLWADLAFRCFVVNRLDICKLIVSSHVKPLLQNISSLDKQFYVFVLTHVAPALYCAHKSTALEQISALPQLQRDQVYAAICRALLHKSPNSEPYNGSQYGYSKVNYEDFVDICELLELMQQDNLVYGFIDKIADILVERKRREIVNNTQKLDIVSRIQNIVANKFPNERFIKHEGYLVAAKAQVLRAKWHVSRSSDISIRSWNELIQSAHAISNDSDRAYVLCIIGSTMTSKEDILRKKVFDDALKVIEDIPIIIDRIQRYHFMAEVTEEIDVNLCRKCLTKAMQVAVTIDDPKSQAVQRQIIDLAYRIDETYAEELATFTDDDPATVDARENINDRLKVLRLKNDLSKKLSGGLDDIASNPDFPAVFWMMLGNLNAGRIDTADIRYVRDIIQLAASFSIWQAYPIYAWVIENLIQRYGSTDNARILLKPLFDATLEGCNVCEAMAIRSSEQLERIVRQVPNVDVNDKILIRKGENDRAQMFLLDWIENHASDYIKVYDLHFGLDDLELLRLVNMSNANIKVQILTSRLGQEPEHLSQNLEDIYQRYWRIKISDQDPPETDIIVVGASSLGTLPLKEQIWLTKSGGIHVTTSFSMLGSTEESHIRLLSVDEVEEYESIIDYYLNRNRRDHSGNRLSYTVITL